MDCRFISGLVFALLIRLGVVVVELIIFHNTLNTLPVVFQVSNAVKPLRKCDLF